MPFDGEEKHNKTIVWRSSRPKCALSPITQQHLVIHHLLIRETGHNATGAFIYKSFGKREGGGRIVPPRAVATVGVCNNWVNK
ncbi:hypothetical protein CEXT_639471 [Caerostris extrusa]|uniref:Uncharacterized protein n=1 Tax=Caerostris extrusa TaxID=172846 RepID=A0AAV4QR03_CAEEX|nr:hypothetical protein CEXT_639471 [Caerostris extrusa]